MQKMHFEMANNYCESLRDETSHFLTFTSVSEKTQTCSCKSIYNMQVEERKSNAKLG